MSDVVELKIPGDRMGLARMGRMTAVTLPDVIAPFIGRCILVDETADHVRVSVCIERITYTTLGHLTPADAERCGYQQVATELTGALLKIRPHLTSLSQVTIIEWRLARDLDPPEIG